MKVITEDVTSHDTYWREKCESEFGLRAQPSERDRYPAGYWKECYEYWKSKDGEK